MFWKKIICPHCIKLVEVANPCSRCGGKINVILEEKFRRTGIRTLQVLLAYYGLFILFGGLKWRSTLNDYTVRDIVWYAPWVLAVLWLAIYKKRLRK